MIWVLNDFEFFCFFGFEFRWFWQKLITVVYFVRSNHFWSVNSRRKCPKLVGWRFSQNIFIRDDNQTKSSANIHTRTHTHTHTHTKFKSSKSQNKNEPKIHSRVEPFDRTITNCFYSYNISYCRIAKLNGQRENFRPPKMT